MSDLEDIHLQYLTVTNSTALDFTKELKQTKNVDIYVFYRHKYSRNSFFLKERGYYNQLISLKRCMEAHLYYFHLSVIPLFTFNKSLQVRRNFYK